jgi:hypothetical protein
VLADVPASRGFYHAACGSVRPTGQERTPLALLFKAVGVVTTEAVVVGGAAVVDHRLGAFGFSVGSNGLCGSGS